MKIKKKYITYLALPIAIIVILMVFAHNNKKIELTDLSAYIPNKAVIYMLAGYELIADDNTSIYFSIKEGRYEEAICELQNVMRSKMDTTERNVYKNALAVAYSIIGEWEKAYGLFKDIEETLEGNEYNLKYSILNNMGITCVYLIYISGEHTRETADNYFKQALEAATEESSYDNLIIRTNRTKAQQMFLNVDDEMLEVIKKEIFLIMEQEKERIGSHQLISLINYANLGNIYNAEGECLKAEKLFRKALKLKEKLAGDEYILRIAEASLYDQLGIVYMNQGENEKAAEVIEKALLLYQKGDETPPIFLSDCYTNIGVVYRRLGNSEKGIECLTKALECNPPSYSRSLVYRNMSSNYYLRNDLEKGIAYRLKAYKILEEGGFDYPVYYETKDELERMYDQSIDIDKSEGFDIWLENQMEELEDEQL